MAICRTRSLPVTLLALVAVSACSGNGADGGNTGTPTGPSPAAPTDMTFAFAGTASNGAPCTGSYTFDLLRADVADSDELNASLRGP
ncbi:MAG: hypothetical protein HY657_09920 [Acidobacteria bacterium]|nr:hypothetical protein [Acidobacteriota bacterium]